VTADHACVICQRTDPADGLTCCGGCLDRLDNDLARIVELTDAAATWVRQHTRGQQASDPRRAPLDLAVVGAADGTEALLLLESWERLTREHFGDVAPYAAVWRLRAARNAAAGVTGNLPLIKAATGFLRACLARIVEDPTYPVEELAREVGALARRLRALDPDRERPDGISVPCQGDHPDADGRECGYRLVVTPDRIADDITCRRCGSTTTAGRMILAAMSDPAVTVWAYPDVIAELYGIPSRTLRHWANAGHIARQGNRYDAGACFRRRHALAT
jgi:hypothetical protein